MMEMMFLLVTLMLLAVCAVSGAARHAFPKVRLAGAPGNLQPAVSTDLHDLGDGVVEVPGPGGPSDDGLVDLPSPDARRVYTEKASAAEMSFAGHYLNLAGLALLVVGTVSYLKVSGFTEKATSGGLLQCLLGAALGGFLTWSGDRLHRQGSRAYALPLLAAGIVILTVTAGASHFTFGLLPIAGLALANFAIVSWAGLAAVRYDSPLVGGCMLIAVFVDPLVMGFPMSNAPILLAYLLAINLAVMVVAYRKKWDAFLIASLTGSYGLYFYQFGLRDPATAVGFLMTIYALYLVSGNLFHFLRRTASDFQLGLSMVNPLVFACVSYAVLLKLPNATALMVYTVVALLHAGLAAIAANVRGQSSAYCEMAKAHLSLALAFFTTAISFLTYLAVDTRYFALVTFLWMVEGFILLKLSESAGNDFALLVRRGSYGAVALASVQLAFVIPTMERFELVELLGMLALLIYFWRHERSEATVEERLFSNFVLLAAVTAGCHSLGAALSPLSTLIVTAALAPAAMLAYLRFPRTLVAYRFVAPAWGVGVATVAVLSPWPLAPVSWNLLLLAGLLGSLAALCLGREELLMEGTVAVMSALALLLRGCGTVAGGSGPLCGWALAALVVAVLFLLGRRFQNVHFQNVAETLAVVVGTGAFLAPVHRTDAWLSLILTGAIFSLLCLASLRDERWRSAAIFGISTGFLLMRFSFVLSSGAGSTLIWCLMALAILKTAKELGSAALAIMFFAFLKSILFDAAFTIGKGGLQMATSPDGPGLLIVASVIGCYGIAASWTRQDPETRNYYSLFGLLIFAFQATFMLHNTYGVLDEFQIILSGFWAGASLLFVTYGIHQENKLFRLFGLVVLVSCVLKIYAVDIWVLDAYSKTTTTLVLGSLLMGVSFLYQANRGRLVEAC